MKTLIIFFLALILFISFAFIYDHPTKKISKSEECPAEPYEEFMLQRTYPNDFFDIKAYQFALNDADRKSKQLRRQHVSSWTLEGPGNIGGRFNCLAVNPVNTDIMYAGSANGGVWKTTDNGLSWIPIFDEIPYQAIGAIAINPNDPNEIWVGTGDLNISGTMYLGNGVYKSTDAGLSWSYRGLATSYVVSSIIFNSANTSEVLIGTMGNSFSKDNNRGIYKTTNGGLSFTQCKFVNDSTGIIDMVQHPTNPSIIYASSFSRIRTNLFSIVLGTEVNVFKSIDFGQTWTTLAGGLPNGVEHERLGLAISKSSPDILYALYSRSDTVPELYKTTDAGLTWSQINFLQFDEQSYGTFGWYFGKIYVDPGDPNTLYIPAIDLLYSTDGGVNWNLRTPPWYFYEVHADGHFMYFKNSNEFIYCTDGGINRTYDGGDNWEDIENIPNNQFYAITENKHNHGEYAGGVQDNGTMYGNAASFNNYTRLYGGDGFTVEYTNDPLIVYAESQRGNIVFDQDYPNGFWSGLNTDPDQNYNWHTPYFVSPFNDDTLYFAGETVMRIDAAPYGNYTIISPVLNDTTNPDRVRNISTINQSHLDREILYAGTADGKVWNTLNAGSTWNDITPFQGVSYYITCVKPSPNNSSIAYVTRSGYRQNDFTPLIYKTVDNGFSWQNISGDLPMLAVNDIEIFPGNEDVIFIANDAGVYATINGGINWERTGDNMPYVAVLDIDFNFNNQKIIAGTFGRSIYSMDVTSIILGIDPVKNNLEVSVYPNPAMSTVFIKSDKEFDKVEIYSFDGRLITESKEKLINVSELAEGNYFIKITQGLNEVVRRFIKL